MPILLGLATAGLAAAFVPMLSVLVVLGLVTVLVAALIESRRLARVVVTLERPPAVALSLDEEERVVAHLRTDCRRPLNVIVRFVWPRLLEADERPRQGVCRPGERLELVFDVRGVERGTGDVERTAVAITEWGLVERIVEAGGAMKFSVLPNLKAVSRLRRQLDRWTLAGLGGRTSASLGKGREFDRLRDWVIGDDFRDIAWKSTARHGRPIVREYRLDRSQEILVCVDRGHRMTARLGRITRFDHAVNAAMLVSYASSRMEDRVGVVTFAGSVDGGLGSGRGVTHLRRLTAYATSIRAESAATDYTGFAVQARRRLPHRTLVLILTTLPELEDEDALVRAVSMLAPQHLPLVVAFSDAELDASARVLPSNRNELGRVLVARDLVAARRKVVTELRRRGAFVVEAAPGEVGVEAVNAYLDLKRRQLL